jgi:hypothetical protein
MCRLLCACSRRQKPAWDLGDADLYGNAVYSQFLSSMESSAQRLLKTLSIEPKPAGK